MVQPSPRESQSRPARRAISVVAFLLTATAGCGTQPAPPPVAKAAAVDPAAVCRRIDGVLDHARDARRLNARDHAAWQIVHGILAFGEAFPIQQGDGTTPALSYLLEGGRLTGWTLRPSSPGVIAVLEAGSKTGQGHPDQWLGYLSQCSLEGLPPDTPLVVAGERRSVNDLIAQAKHDLRPGQEATWTLMALATYLPPEAAWTSGDGEEWSLERLVAMEAGADLAGSACGGSHRLYGLAVAVNRYLAATGLEPDDLTGGWAAAEARIQEGIEKARRFQQPDGSFSTSFFERPGSSPDVFARIGATGHTFEFLAMALDGRRLTEPWMQRAAAALVTLLEQTADVPVECGGLYHAAHGLVLYRARTCGQPVSAEATTAAAKRPAQSD